MLWKGTKIQTFLEWSLFLSGLKRCMQSRFQFSSRRVESIWCFVQLGEWYVEFHHQDLEQHSPHYLVPSFTEYLWQLVETLNWSVTLSAFGGRYFYFSSSWKKLLQELNWFEVTKTRQLYWQHDKEHSKNINECFGSRQTLLWNRKHPTCASTSFVLVYGRVLLFNFWSSKV